MTKLLPRILCLVAFTSVSSAAASVSAIVELTTANHDSKRVLKITYVNRGTEPVSIRVTDLPRGDSSGKLIRSAFHVVAIDGSLPEYLGYHAGTTREALTRVISIKPGQSVTREIDIAVNYALQAGMSYDVTATEFRQAPTSSLGNVPLLFTSTPTIRIIAPR